MLPKNFALKHKVGIAEKYTPSVDYSSSVDCRPSVEWRVSVGYVSSLVLRETHQDCKKNRSCHFVMINKNKRNGFCNSEKCT